MTQYIKPEDQSSGKPFNPSEKHVEVVNRVYNRFTSMRTERDKVRREFDYRTLKEYVQDSVDAYNGIVSDEIKQSKEDWQSLIWDHETRGKVKTIVSMIVGARPFMSFSGSSESDNEFADDLLNVYTDAWKKENGSYQLYKQALSAAVKGTVIVEEMYVEEKHKIKEIVKIDQETGLIESKEKDVIRGGYGHVKSEIFPLLDFYPNENYSEIKEDCTTLKLYTMKSFKNKYGKYPNAQYVVEGIFGGDHDDIEYKSVSQNKNELIEVMRYYNENYDEFIVIANGVWINPQKNDTIAPIPFDHHRLPFAKTVFELSDENCFYGKSFPDILSGEQETRNALLRLMIDQEILATNKPILLGGGVEIESYELYPGATPSVNGPIDQVQELGISGSNQSAFQLLQLLKRNSNENSSIDTVTQGVSSGGRKTAREAVILDENGKRVSATFQIFIYKFLLERAKLRLSNIQQFYTEPIQYAKLKDKYGKDLMVGDKQQYKAEYREITVLEPGAEPRWIKMKPAMRRANINVEFIEDYEVPLNRSARQEVARDILEEAKNNPLMNADNATIDFIEAMGRNPERLYLKPTKEQKDFQDKSSLPPQNSMDPNNQIMPPQ